MSGFMKIGEVFGMNILGKDDWAYLGRYMNMAIGKAQNIHT